MRLRRYWDQLRGWRPLSGGRLITWLFVPVLLILAAAAVITFLAYEDVVQAEVVDRERERAYLSANRLKEEMGKFTEVLDSLARTEAVYQGDADGQRAALREARRRLAIFDGGVVLLDNFGEVLGTEPERPEIAGQDWSARPYFRRLLSGESVFFSDAVTDGSGGAPVVVIAVPVTTAHGEFLGVLAGMFRLGEPTISALYASLVRLRVAEDVYLVDGGAQVIYHPDAERIGDQLAADPIVAEVLGGQVGARRVGNGRQAAVAAFAPVPGTTWGLVTEQAWSALVSPSRRYSQFLLLLLVLGIVLPGAWFGLLARQRRAEAVDRAHLEHQLQVARVIQQTLLPKELPAPAGWRLRGHYQPAQAVGGDFYDVLRLPEGRLGVIIGDVTDKGVPAALLMATTRSLLRTVAQRAQTPSQVLHEVNELLGNEIPPKMFVTCLYAVLDPQTGRLTYANAGHNLPYRSRPGSGPVGELRATGMPLGLMPGMVYEERETTIDVGECILFYSDGLVEAHNPHREMFGNPRLQQVLAGCAEECPTLIPHLLGELESFTGRGWQQEDDVTLVTLQRFRPGALPQEAGAAPPVGDPEEAGWYPVAEFSLPSLAGNERTAIQQVHDAVRGLGLPPSSIERLKTAVGEATMNAIEHGNALQPDRPVEVQVLASPEAVKVQVSDQGNGPPDRKPSRPDLEAKIAGRQSPRGWGLFLMENMVDQVNVIRGDARYTVELLLSRKEQDEDQSA